MTPADRFLLLQMAERHAHPATSVPDVLALAGVMELWVEGKIETPKLERDIPQFLESRSPPDSVVSTSTPDPSILSWSIPTEEYNELPDEYQLLYRPWTNTHYILHELLTEQPPAEVAHYWREMTGLDKTHWLLDRGEVDTELPPLPKTVDQVGHLNMPWYHAVLYAPGEGGWVIKPEYEAWTVDEE